MRGERGSRVREGEKSFCLRFTAFPLVPDPITVREDMQKHNKHYPDEAGAEICDNCGHGYTYCVDCSDVTYYTEDGGSTWEIDVSEVIDKLIPTTTGGDK